MLLPRANFSTEVGYIDLDFLPAPTTKDVRHEENEPLKILLHGQLSILADLSKGFILGPAAYRRLCKEMSG